MYNRLMKPDILISDAVGRPIAIVEVKGGSRKSAKWAAEFRRNLLAEYPGSPPPFFLLATPERFDFWKEQTSKSAVQPDFSMNPGDLIKSYDLLGDAHAGSLSGSALELIVADWLRDLVRGRNGGDKAGRWLSTSGFLDAIRGGRVALEPEA